MIFLTFGVFISLRKGIVTVQIQLGQEDYKRLQVIKGRI